MRRLLPYLPVLIVAALASVAMFARLDLRYLWQDEAACAVMAGRMMQYGKPLAYDGRNLITMDEYRHEEAATLSARIGRPDEAVAFYVAKGDFKEDTTWIGQPWGQFVLAGLSLELFGKGTLQARFPFALAGVATAVLLFLLVQRSFGDPWMAWVAVALLLGNVFWFLHTRQCRYYSPSTLMGLVTFASFLRWQDGRRFGAAAFVLAGWTWFQFDFGSVWPVYGVFFVDALRVAFRDDRRSWWKPVATFAVLGVLLVPFVLYYEMLGRFKEPFDPWLKRFLMTVFSVNQFQLPILLLLGVVWLWPRPSSNGADGGTRPAVGPARVLGLALAVIAGQTIWMPTVGPMAYYRYVVDLTPISVLVVAWVVTTLARRAKAPVLVVPATALLILTPWVSLPVALAFPHGFRMVPEPAAILRPELDGFRIPLDPSLPDPNRDVIEALLPRLRPDDEILVNYEDVPFMFYTDNRVRGGIPCFRVADPDARPPRFAVIRRTVAFIHWDPYRQAIGRYEWATLPIHTADIPWGNNPDPNGAALPLFPNLPDLSVWEFLSVKGR